MEQETQYFLNCYQCPRCRKFWSDMWSAMCDDDCPHCGCRHITPFKSLEIGIETVDLTDIRVTAALQNIKPTPPA